MGVIFAVKIWVVNNYYPLKNRFYPDIAIFSPIFALEKITLALGLYLMAGIIDSYKTVLLK